MTNQKSPYPKREYSCPVDNFTTKDPNAFDEHIKQTGHVFSQDYLDRNEHTTDKVPDTMFQHRITTDTGKGLNTGDFLDDPSAEESSRSRAFSQGKDIPQDKETSDNKNNK